MLQNRRMVSEARERKLTTSMTAMIGVNQTGRPPGTNAALSPRQPCA